MTWLMGGVLKCQCNLGDEYMLFLYQGRFWKCYITWSIDTVFWCRLYGHLHTVASPFPQLTQTVTVLSVLLSLVLTLSLSTCAVSAVVHAVMYKRLQRCRTELRGGTLCSTPQLSPSLLWSRAASSLHAGGGVSIRADPEEERPPTMDEEEEEGKKMQANPTYLPIETSY